MTASDYRHITVLLDEAVEHLALRADGCYVDGTFGRGGHSRLILEGLGAQGRLLGFDKDPLAMRKGGCSVSTRTLWRLPPATLWRPKTAALSLCSAALPTWAMSWRRVS